MVSFSLTVHILPVGSDLSTVLQLEQFFIDTLNPAYNILRVAGSSTGRPISDAHKQKLRDERGSRIYIYNRDCSTLLCVFLSKTQLFAMLGIHHTTLNSFLGSGAVYLNSFVFTLEPLDPDNISGTMTLDEFVELFTPLHAESEAIRLKNKVHPASAAIQAINIHDSSLSFSLPSLTKMAKHFGVDKSTIQRRLETGAVFRDSWT